MGTQTDNSQIPFALVSQLLVSTQMVEGLNFRGVTLSQDPRFVSKNKKLRSSVPSVKIIKKKINLELINLDYLFETIKACPESPIDLQISITAFIGKTAAKEFIEDLWRLLLDAQASSSHVPSLELMKQLSAARSVKK